MEINKHKDSQDQDQGKGFIQLPLVSCERGDFLSLIMAVLLSGVIEYRDLFGQSSATVPVNNK